MQTIYKYKLKREGLHHVELPVGARLLTVQPLGAHIWVWAIVSAEEKKKERRWFAVYKTGEPIDVNPGELKHIGTAQFEGGELVLHVFEFTELAGHDHA
ncbi:MAG: hypothetical protein HZA89_01040 [Verrucomicrobia bacterium]|nr:hypothetical protein [Verrucomicrobiota bacterium]